MSRVLLLIKGLGRGGAEQLLASAAPHLDGDRFRYEAAYLLPHKDALAADLEAAGIRVHCLDGDRDGRWVARLGSLVRRRGFETVHAHSPVAAIGARLRFPRRRRGPRLVYTEHNVWERYHRATYWANAVTYPRNDYVIAVSQHVTDSIRYPAAIRSLRMPPVETRYQGIDVEGTRAGAALDGVRDELRIPADAPVVGMVGNFKPGKGHGDLVEAVALVRAHVPDVRFVLVGRGPFEPDVRRRARELDVASSMIFAGYREDARRVMTAFDVLAVPSVYDGLSIALLEAMGLGVPPVLTRVGGNPEAVRDGEHGLVVPPRDPRALADGIVTLLRDPGLRRRLGEAAGRRARDFDIRAAVRRTEAIYGELLR
jgi:glycosyltransferase involved in cell wall biosynthesis